MSNKGGRVSPDYLADIAPEYATVAKLPLTLRMHSRFTQTRSTHRTHGPRAVTLLQTVTSAYALMPSSRWSSLMKSGQAL